MGEMKTPEKTFWSVEETANFLTVSKDFVRKLAKSGSLPSYRFGYIFRFDPDQIRDWVKKCQIQPFEIPAVRPQRMSGKNTKDLLDRVIGKAQRSVYTQSSGKPGPKKGGN